MTQQPGQGQGPFGPQDQGGPPGPNPQGPQGPNPYGASPPPPQQPGPYGAQPNPYGAQPGPYGSPPPQPPAYPSQPQYGSQQPTYGAPAGGGGQPGYPSQPQFTAPQQPYGAPQGQQFQNPYGAPPQAYQAPGAAWSPAGGLPPAPPVKKSRTGLIVGVLALVLVLVGGATAWFFLQPKTTTATGTTTSATATTATSATKAATSAATKATTAATKATTTSAGGSGAVVCSGGSIDASDYTAKVPTGWDCGKQTTSLTLTDAKFDTVIVFQMQGTTDAAKVCSSMSNAGDVTALPDTQWGGKTAKTEDIASGNTKMHVRCVATANSVYYLMALPITGTYAEILSGVDALTSGWAWK